MSLRALARALLRRRTLDDDLDEEIRSHFELLVEQHAANGMDHRAAQRAARLELGTHQVQDAVRDVRSGARVERLGRDATLAVRRLMRSPALVTAMVGTLVVGLGAGAVVYTTVKTILIDPLPYRSPADLYVIWRDYGPLVELHRGWLAGTDIAELRKAGGVIENAVGLGRQSVTFSVRRDTDPIRIAVMVTSPDLFELLGTAPVLGRGFAEGEVGPGRPPLVILTHELWRQLGAAPTILGTEVWLDGQPYTVIGVLPSRFTFVRHASLGPAQHVDAYTTFNVNLADTSPGNGSYAGVLRARRGTSPQAVAAAVEGIGRMIDARDFRSRGLKLYAVGLKPDLVSAVRPALLVLAFAGACMVLVLGVNLASVLLARAAERQHEFAVSRALGASGVVIVRAMLFEGGILGLIGGAAAAVAAIWGTRVLVALAPLNLPRRETVAVDWTIAAAVIGTGLLLGLLAAAVPAVWAARASLSSLLAARAVRGGGGQGRMGRHIVVGQVALSLMLLSAGGLVARSFERLIRADPGFKSEGVLTFRVSMPPQLFPATADALAVQNRIHDGLEKIPGVTGVSAVDALPLTANPNSTTIAIPGAPGNTGEAERDGPLVDYIGTRAGYIDVMGIRVVVGRGFDRGRRDNVREALIDRRLANHFFPVGNPLGAKIAFRDGSLTVIGVVEQARLYNVHQDGRPQLFLRAEDWAYRDLSFVLRAGHDPLALVPDVRTVLRRIDPRLALGDVRTMDDIVSDALRQQRISAVLIAGFALGALLLAAMGLFSAVAQSVTRRRFELAMRLALGANAHGILRLVVTDGTRLVGLGLIVGVPGIYLAGRLLRGLLVGVSPFDPLTLLAVASGTGLVGTVACYLPARRVLKIEPAQLLRQE